MDSKQACPPDQAAVQLPALPRSSGPVLFVATSSASKLEEFRLAAGLWRKEHVGADIPGSKCLVGAVPGLDTLPPCEEDGDTFSANAEKKALHYSRFACGLVMADDSGIEVDALAGAPGARSRRYAGSNPTDAQNNAKLLHALQGTPAAKRGARFVCILAIARRGEVVAEFRGEASGILLEEPRGAAGFGYDPLFFDPGLQKSFAEMSAEEKLSRSHRGAAMHAMLEWLARHPHWLAGEK